MGPLGVFQSIPPRKGGRAGQVCSVGEMCPTSVLSPLSSWSGGAEEALAGVYLTSRHGGALVCTLC